MQDIIKAKSEFGRGETAERTPEAQVESGEARPKERPETEAANEALAQAAVPAGPGPGVSEARAEADPIAKQIEEFLSDDLLDLYAQMPPDVRANFKAKGEETASKITIMLRAAKVVAKEILELIVSWLKIIPGVNQFFLEQEAKIKTDKILAFAEEQKARKVS